MAPSHFDLAQSKYSISGEYSRCLLHPWSEERNAVRRVLEAEVKNGTPPTHAGRLAVVELKADEDIHLPRQGLDYWARVEWHHAGGEFPRFGYFESRELSSEKSLPDRRVKH